MMWPEAASVIGLVVFISAALSVSQTRASLSVDDTDQAEQSLICATNRKLLARNRLYINETAVNITIGTGPRPVDRILAFMLRVMLNDDYGFSVNVVTYEHDLAGWAGLMNCDVDSRGQRCGEIPMIYIGLFETADQRVTLTENVRSAGYLDLNVKLGWFVSSHVVDSSVDGLAPDHYRYFKTAALAESFDSVHNLSQLTRRSKSSKWCDQATYARCNENGMYVPAKCRGAGRCATLLAAFPHENYEFVVQQIESLELFVKVAWIGKKFENHILRWAVKKKARRLLFIDYSVSLLTQSRDTFTEVLFPSCSSVDRPAGCNYQFGKLHKIYWRFLETGAGQVVKLLNNIDIREADLRSILNEKTAQMSEDDSIQEFACRAVQTDLAERWSTGVDAYPKIKIHTIFPDANSGLINVTAMAIDHINGKYFKGVILEQNVVNGECSREVVLKQYINDISNSQSQIVGVVGPECNRSLDSLFGVADHYKHVVMSYRSDSVTDEETRAHEFFFRLPPDTNLLASAYVEFIQSMGWSHFAAFTDAYHQSSSYVSELQASAQNNVQTFHGPYKYSKLAHIGRVLRQMKKQPRAKIIVGDFPLAGAHDIMCEAFKLNMTARYGYVWLLPSWLPERWLQTALSRISCTSAEMREAIEFSFIYKFKELADDDHVMENNMSVSSWKAEVIKKNAELTQDAGFAYDAVWALGSGLGELFNANQMFLANLRHSNQDISANSLNQFIQKISSNRFRGATGSIQFNRNYRQPENITLYEYYDSRLHIIGFSHLLLGGTEDKIQVNIDTSKLRWYKGVKPGDGAPTCVFQALADLLNLPCQVAQIFAISGVIVGSLVVIGGLGAGSAYRYYERKMKILEQNQSSSLMLTENELPEERVRIYRSVGEGAFGKVYFGEYVRYDGYVMKVAIKSAKDPKNVNAKMELLSEAEVMKQFDHVNILRLIGVIVKPNKCQIVTEFMMYGSLRNYLLDRRHLVAKGNIGAVHLTRMAVDICRGLSYLCSKNYVHGDLACRNCLVHESQTIKIADFGFCKNLVDQHYYRIVRTGPMPVRWMSPELLTTGVYQTESDIWSFGIVLYEIITFGGHPYHNLDDHKVQDFIRAGGFPALPQKVSSELEALLLRIWSRGRRPSAMELFETLISNPELIHPCVDETVVIQSVSIGNELYPGSTSHGSSTRTSRNRIRQPESLWRRRNPDDDIELSLNSTYSISHGVY